MKIKILGCILFVVFLACLSFAAVTVDNYFEQTNSTTNDNVFVVGGTQNVTGTLNVTGTFVSSGTSSFTDLTVSTLTVTNNATFGSLTDSTATLTGGAITGLLDFTTSSGTVTNQLTAGSITDSTATLTGGAITGLLDFTTSSGTVTNQLTVGTVNITHDSTNYELVISSDVTVQKELKFSVNVDTTTSPEVAAIIGVNASNELYISTGTGAGAWVKVGAQ